MKKQQLKFTRPPWERMLRIHEEIQNPSDKHQLPNAETLRIKLNTSLRTIKRDIQFMRDRLNLPVAFDASRQGYFYEKPVDRFPTVAITEQEMFALFVADKAIAQYQGTPFHRPLRMAFEKLAEHLDAATRYTVDNLDEIFSFRPFAPETTDLRNFQTIASGLQKRHALKFSYRNLGTQIIKQRHVHPYHLACIDNQWYIFGFDLGANAIRTFTLSRLNEPVVTEEKFTKPKSFKLSNYLRDSLNVMSGNEEHDVVIEFDVWGTDLVRGRRWHPSQKLEERADGTSQMRLRLGGLEEVERWILGLQTHAKVISPPELVCRIKQTTAAIAGQYCEKV